MNKLHAILSLVLTLIALWILVGCKKGETVPDIEAVPDSLITDTTYRDTIQETVEVIPSKRADELFDDFAFAFMKNRKYQKERINFPLPYTVDGKTSNISASAWTFDRMYSQEEVYTLIFDSMKGEKAAKDTTINSVIVEELNLDTRRTKKYDFQRLDGEWKLTALADQEIGGSPNSEFYTFYHRFATDPDYRASHLAESIDYSTYDYDNFESVKKTITPEEFADVSPELPQTKITNILYGQNYKNSKLRVLSIRALSGGMQCDMVFKKTNGEWMLTRLDN